MDMTESDTGEAKSRLAKIAFWGALAGLAALAAAGPLVRAGMPFGTAAQLMLAGASLGLLFALLGLFVLLVWRRRRPGLPLWQPLGAIVLGFLAAGILFALLQSARAVPPIHDISTDTDDPPRFVAVLDARAGAPNPPEYAGADVAAQQRSAYPDLVPLRLDVPPREALARAEAAVEAEGLELVRTDSAAGTVEATATTAWFGFRDDVVIRVRPAAGGGSIVDLRSKSRVGQSDLGANAARIRALAERIDS